MKHITKLVSLVLMLAVSPLVLAQFSDLPNKVLYERTQTLPTGIAFDATLSMLKHSNDSGSRDVAVGRIQRYLSMDASAASAFLDQLMIVEQEMGVEVELAVSAHACSEGDGYDLLDQLSDVSEAIFDAYYDRTKDQLDRATGVRLDNWMSRTKSIMTYGRVDYEKLDELKGTDSRASLAVTCKE